MVVAIIGGGASGLACAVSIGMKAKLKNLNIDIIVYEAKERVGKKILATGNGRCNMMNINQYNLYFDSNNFSDFALEKFDVRSNLEFFSELGLYTRYDEEGRVYPLSNQSTSVLDALRLGCERLGVKFVTECSIETVKVKNGRFLLNGRFEADKVVLSCGGKAGVKNFSSYELVKSLGHKVTCVKPSLSKFEVKDKKIIKPLKGVRVKGEFSLFDSKKNIATEKGELLFTDYGLSGIAVMQLSAYATRFDSVSKLQLVADFVPELSFNDLCEDITFFAKSHLSGKNENLLSGFLPKKLGEVILKTLNINLTSFSNELTEKEIKAIALKMKKFTFDLDSVRGFEDAQVTAGGVVTSEFNNRTMESKKVKGLYCTGEFLDVDGLCGGYNLHWAWSSGRLCGESIVDEILNRKGKK